MVYKSMGTFLRRCLLILYLSISFSATASDSVESSSGVDGSGRWRFYNITRWEKWSFGLSFLFDWGVSTNFMAGINSPLLTLGHLNDAGLASEVRNPSYASVARLIERTNFQADLRSNSSSRIGIVLSPWEGRVGVGWERRKSGDFGFIWFIPVQMKHWSTEVFAEGGIHKIKSSDSSWYPESTGDSGGPAGIAALRIKFNWKNWDWGITTMLSGGTSYRAGGLVAGGVHFSKNKWRFRSRLSWASDYFRDGDGNFGGHSGFSGDFSYRPTNGLQIGFAYKFPFISESARVVKADETNVYAGWRFDKLRFQIDFDWKHIVIPNPDKKKTAAIRLSGLVRYAFSDLDMELRVYWHLPDAWSVKVKGEFNITEHWLWNLSGELYQENEDLLFDFRLKWILKLRRHRIMLSLFLGDIPRDWENGGLSAGDADVQLTWTADIGK